MKNALFILKSISQHLISTPCFFIIANLYSYISLSLSLHMHAVFRNVQEWRNRISAGGQIRMLRVNGLWRTYSRKKNNLNAYRIIFRAIGQNNIKSACCECWCTTRPAMLWNRPSKSPNFVPTYIDRFIYSFILATLNSQHQLIIIHFNLKNLFFILDDAMSRIFHSQTSDLVHD